MCVRERLGVPTVTGLTLTGGVCPPVPVPACRALSDQTRLPVISSHASLLACSLLNCRSEYFPYTLTPLPAASLRTAF